MNDNLENKGNIDAVLFDFGGVIAEEGFQGGLAAIARANGLDEKQFILAAHDAIYATGYVLGKADEQAYWRALKEETGIKGDDKDLREEIISRFLLRDWMLDLVRRLKAKNIIVGILSDQTDWLDTLDRKLDFFRWFDHVFNSFHLGKGKRDITLFDDVSRELKTDPKRMLFIDDDPGHIDRASRRDWQTIHYVDRESFERAFKEIMALRA